MQLSGIASGSPEHFNSWSCSGGTWVLELLLLSCQMKDGVLKTGQEWVPLPFALLLFRGRYLSACLFLSYICWHHNKDLMIWYGFVTSSFFCGDLSFITGCWRESKALKMKKFGNSCRKLTYLPQAPVGCCLFAFLFFWTEKIEFAIFACQWTKHNHS